MSQVIFVQGDRRLVCGMLPHKKAKEVAYELTWYATRGRRRSQCEIYFTVERVV